MLLAALTGFAFGFIGSMPIAGPIAILVFGRGLEDRRRSGMYLAAGAAIAESIYAYLAFWGFSAFLARYAFIEPVSRGAAAVILTALGAHLVRKRRDASAPLTPPDPNVGNKRSFFLGFTITVLNPTLIATWTAAVTTVYALHWVQFDEGGALPFSVGAFAGIVGWFAILLWLLGRFRARFSRTTLDRVMRAMGYLLICLGMVFAYRFVAHVWSR
jgi:threonine/homoserine/homoserine lactone efflux protein